MVRDEEPLIWRYGIAIYDETSNKNPRGH
jgi:hypothetical protein